MNLLGVLLKTLLAKRALNALSKKTGLSSKQLKKLLPLALPLLVKLLTKNASEKDGALSLLGALTQHTSTKPVEQQIEEADTEDGAKIVGHILGKESQSSLLSLSQQSGLSQKEVSGALSGIAPTLLSVLSAAMSSGSSKVDLSDGLDLSDVLALFSGSKPKSTGLFGSLFGKKTAKKKRKSDAGLDGAALIKLLLAASK